MRWGLWGRELIGRRRWRWWRRWGCILEFSDRDLALWDLLILFRTRKAVGKMLQKVEVYSAEGQWSWRQQVGQKKALAVICSAAPFSKGSCPQSCRSTTWHSSASTRIFWRKTGQDRIVFVRDFALASVLLRTNSLCPWIQSQESQYEVIRGGMEEVLRR